MNCTIAWVKFDVMERFMADVFRAAGVPDDDAKICAEILITADKLGIDSTAPTVSNLSIDRIKAGILSPVTNMEIVRKALR